MKRSTRPAALAALALAAGCSTVPLPAPLPLEPRPGIRVQRDTGFTAGGCAYAISVDDQEIGSLRAGESLTKYMPSGRYRLTAANSTWMCPNVILTRIVELADRPVVMRLGFAGNFQVIFDQIE